MTADLSDLNRLTEDLGRVPGNVVRDAMAVLHRGANNVVRDARKLISGLAHAPHYPKSIGYDVITIGVEGGAIAAEIGPDKEKLQGPLGVVLEYGTAKTAPLAHLGPALDMEGPRFEQALADVVGQIL